MIWLVYHHIKSLHISIDYKNYNEHKKVGMEPLFFERMPTVGTHKAMIQSNTEIKCFQRPRIGPATETTAGSGNAYL